MLSVQIDGKKVKTGVADNEKSGVSQPGMQGECLGDGSDGADAGSGGI
jgi:hypothetical protein